MLGLPLLLLSILSTSGAELGLKSTELTCDKRLDVISYSEWPILSEFSLELIDNALLMNVDYDYASITEERITRAVLYDRRRKTYIHEVDVLYNTTNGHYKTRELTEISGLSVKDIKFGWEFIIIMTDDGSAWTAGSNEQGQLSGDTTSRPTFTRVQGVPAVKEIAAGLSHCIVLTQDNELFSWGISGALGYNTTSVSNPTPTQFSLGQEVSLPTSICCSRIACMALTEDGKVFTWGNLAFIGRSGDAEVPGLVQSIPSGETIIKVACGTGHMVALASSGSLYGWGMGDSGELLQIPSFETRAIKLDLGEKVVRDVVAGCYFTIVRTDAEKVYYFGFRGGINKNATQLEGGMYPRDLMAKGASEQVTHGSVSLGCK